MQAALGEWLANFWEEAVQDLEQEALWDVWFMGSTPFPSEVRIHSRSYATSCA